MERKYPLVKEGGAPLSQQDIQVMRAEVLREVYIDKAVFQLAVADDVNGKDNVKNGTLATINQPIHLLLGISLEKYAFEKTHWLAICDKLSQIMPKGSKISIKIGDTMQALNLYAIYIAKKNSENEKLPEKIHVFSRETVELVTNCNIDANPNPQNKQEYLTNALKFLPLTKKMTQRWLSSKHAQYGLLLLTQAGITVETSTFNGEFKWMDRTPDQVYEYFTEKRTALYASDPQIFNGKRGELASNFGNDLYQLFTNCQIDGRNFCTFASELYLDLEIVMFSELLKSGDAKSCQYDYNAYPSKEIPPFAFILQRLMQCKEVSNSKTQYLKMQHTRKKYRLDDEPVIKSPKQLPATSMMAPVSSSPAAMVRRVGIFRVGGNPGLFNEIMGDEESTSDYLSALVLNAEAEAVLLRAQADAFALKAQAKALRKMRDRGTTTRDASPSTSPPAPSESGTPFPGDQSPTSAKSKRVSSLEKNDEVLVMR